MAYYLGVVLGSLLILLPLTLGVEWLLRWVRNGTVQVLLSNGLVFTAVFFLAAYGAADGGPVKWTAGLVYLPTQLVILAVTFFAMKGRRAKARQPAADKAPTSPPRPDMADVFKIVRAYGEVLEDSAGGFADVTALPLPKEQLKMALKLAWVAETDAKRKEQIEGGFMVLSDFREGIGPNTVRRELGTDMAFLTSPEGRAKLKTVTELDSAALAEMKELLAEFGAFKAAVSDRR